MHSLFGNSLNELRNIDNNALQTYLDTIDIISQRLYTYEEHKKKFNQI